MVRAKPPSRDREVADRLVSFYWMTGVGLLGTRLRPASLNLFLPYVWLSRTADPTALQVLLDFVGIGHTAPLSKVSSAPSLSHPSKQL